MPKIFFGRYISGVKNRMCENVVIRRKMYRMRHRPYRIQMNLIDRIMSTLSDPENSPKVTIVQSPTGTGKSISIITAVSQWVLDYKEGFVHNHQIEIEKSVDVENVDESKELPDWLVQQMKETDKKNDFDVREKIKKFSETLPELFDTNTNIDPEGDSKKMTFGKFQKMMKKEGVPVNTVIPRVYYVTRTYSQIEQFVEEFSNSPYANVVRFSAYISREHTCIHEDISKITPIEELNTACRFACREYIKEDENLKRRKTPKKTKNLFKCEHNQKTNENIKDVAKFIFSSEFKNSKTLKNFCKENNTCPYYSLTRSMPVAEIIAMPYSLLLDENIRDSMKFELENSVVIIDEGHNLIQSIEDIYNYTLNRETLTCVVNFLDRTKKLLSYKDAKKKNEKVNNEVYESLFIKLMTIGQIFISQIEKNVALQPLMLFGNNISQTNKQPYTTNTNTDEQLFRPSEFLDCTNLSNINMFGIFELLDEILIKKNHVFTDNKYQRLFKNEVKGTQKNTFEMGKFLALLDQTGYNQLQEFSKFLKCLFVLSDENRVLVTDECVKLIRFDSHKFFEPFVKKCRSVFIVGGTIEPVNYLKDYIMLTELDDEQIKYARYTHVIDSSRIKCLVVEDKQLKFSYANQNNVKVAAALTDYIERIVGCRSNYGGVIVFFPSYRYMDYFIEYLLVNDLLAGIKNKMPLFVECKDALKWKEQVKRYKAAIDAKNSQGAILFAVANGKLSEGINFSDKYGRIVVMVGMPFRSLHSKELMSKMEHLTQKYGKSKADEFYNGMCMQSVNQCIGRAIRHKRDYAAMVLIDSRYAKKKYNEKLSDFVRPSIKNVASAKECGNELTSFFDSIDMETECGVDASVNNTTDLLTPF